MIVNFDSIGSGNGLSPDRHQAIIHTNVDMLLIGPHDQFCNSVNILWNPTLDMGDKQTLY